MSNGKGRGPERGYNREKYAANYDEIFRKARPNPRRPKKRLGRGGLAGAIGKVA